MKADVNVIFIKASESRLMHLGAMTLLYRKLAPHKSRRPASTIQSEFQIVLTISIVDLMILHYMHA